MEPKRLTVFLLVMAMIQRIQSIYLFLVTVLGVLLCCFPMAQVISAANEFTLSMGSTIPYSVLIAIMPVLSFATIFLYKRRVVQMRLCSFNIVLSVLTLILSAIYMYIAYDNGSKIIMHWPCVIMPVNIILLYLAARAIGKDEALVRSLDRLR